MKYRYFIFLSIIFSLLFYDDFSLRNDLKNNQYAQTRVYYSQTSNSDQALVNLIQQADAYVYFAVYTLTKQNIVDALIAAKLRGLDVQGITDYNQSLISQEKPLIKKLKKYGINVKAPVKKDGLMHIKLLITDKAYASGSFNWTVSAAKYNDEVLEIGKVKGIHDDYLKIWNSLDQKYK